jgi:LytR cell envelope-related transcriptional attenuator
VNLPQRRTSRAHPDRTPQVLVEVYNNSGVTGLAAKRARLLEGAGWKVAATDNWYGDIPANTVYYPPRLHADARRLAKVLGILRLRPAVAPMQFDRLTVIFTQP